MQKLEIPQVDFECLKCGRQFKNFNGLLGPHDSLSCDVCGTTIRFEVITSRADKSRDAA
jgi:DNA-directed RNA polymerase subunit RPC12/RpoP